jgi:hypothetical protein
MPKKGENQTMSKKQVPIPRIATVEEDESEFGKITIEGWYAKGTSVKQAIREIMKRAIALAPY